MSEKDKGDRGDKGDKDSKVADILKKVMNTGLGAAFMTEEAVKGILSELSLPKEMFNNVIQGAKSTKEEFLATVKNGVKEYLNQIDIRKELEKILETHDIEMEAKFSLKKKGSKGPRPKSET